MRRAVVILAALGVLWLDGFTSMLWFLVMVGLISLVYYECIKEPTQRVAQSLREMSKRESHEWYLTQQNLHLHKHGDPTRPTDEDWGGIIEVGKRR